MRECSQKHSTGCYSVLRLYQRQMKLPHLRSVSHVSDACEDSWSFCVYSVCINSRGILGYSATPQPRLVPIWLLLGSLESLLHRPAWCVGIMKRKQCIKPAETHVAGESLGVGHYGLSSPSLEEVFLRVTTEEHASSPQAVPPQHTSHPDSTDSPHDHTNSSTSTPFASHSNGQSRRDEPSRDGTSHASGSAVGGTASPATAAGQAPRPLRSLSSASASASASELHGDGDHTSAFETVDLDDRPMYKQQLPAEQQHVHQPPLTAGLSGHSPRSSTASAVRADGTGPPSYGTKAGAYQPPAGWHRHVKYMARLAYLLPLPLTSPTNGVSEGVHR